MKLNSLKMLQAFLWCVCATHAGLGIGINVSTDFIHLAASCYGATADLTPQLLTILHPLGAFMFILGVFAAVDSPPSL
jgi:hypothetical protein